MDEGAERDEAETGLAVAVFVVALVALGLAPQRGASAAGPDFGVGRRLEAVAGGGGERQDRGGGERQADGGHLRAAEPASSWRGTHSIASPTTPPSPVGSGQLAGVGSSDAQPAASAEPTTHKTSLSRMRSSALFGRSAASPSRPAAISADDAGEAEELHRDVGDDRAGTAEPIVDRRRRSRG